jgi:hypothetical protein
MDQSQNLSGNKTAEKKYLTPDLIKEVLRQASDIVWQMGVFAKFTKKWYDVITISPLGLIHIEGNEDTGWQHISERHGYYSGKGYFGSGALGTPNKFTKQSIPIYDYRDVADDVFRFGKLDDKPHSDGQLFLKYKGKSRRYTGSDGTEKDFHLVLYRGTKIVHSLYPSKNLEGKLPKRVLDGFIRANDKISFEHKISDNFLMVYIPYENTEGIIRYTIMFKIDKETQQTKGYIQTHALNGCPIFITYPELCNFQINTVLPKAFEYPDIEFVRFINGLTLADLSKLETAIAQIEEQIQIVVARGEEE